jgi:hypothetical protein
MNPTQKQFSLNRAASKKQILIKLMKPIHHVVMSLVVLCLALPPQFPSLAAREEASQERTQYSFASANFNYEVPCVVTYVSIFATDETIIGDGTPITQQTVYVTIDRLEYCVTDKEFYATGYVTLNPNEFNLDARLNRASLDATVVVEDYYSGVTVPVEIHMEWTATSDVSNAKSQYQIQRPDFKEGGTSLFKWTSAQAAGEVLIDGENYTPEPTAGGGLQSQKSFFSMVAQSPLLDMMSDRWKSLAFYESLVTASAETGHLKARGLVAFENKETTEGCVRTGSQITISDETVSFATRPNRLILLTVIVYHDNVCTHEVYTRAVAQEIVPASVVVFGGGGATAALDTSIVVTDHINGGSFPVDIHLNWTAVGERTSERYQEYQDVEDLEPGGDFKINYQERRWSYQAEVTGTVTGLGLNFLGEACGHDCVLVKQDLDIRTLTQGSN